MSTRFMVVASDIHSGSTLALMPPKFQLLEGQEVRSNKLQGWLWDCWEDAWKWVDKKTGGEGYHLVLNGDLTEGCHHRSTQLISPDFGDHIALAEVVLDKACSKADKIFVVEGTECHTHNAEHHIAKHFGAVPCSITDKPAWPMLRVEINGSMVHASHHVGTTARPYLEGSQFSPTMATERLDAMRGGWRVPDMVFRAHRHKFGMYQDDSGAMAVTPCWQGLTRFANKVVPSALPQCGLLLVEWDDIGSFNITPRLYKMKQGKVLSV